MLRNAIAENFSPEDKVIVELISSNGDFNLRIKKNKLVKKLIYRSYTRSGNELASFAKEAKIAFAEGSYLVPLKDVLNASTNLSKVSRFKRDSK